MADEEKQSEVVRILRRIEKRMGAFETKLDELGERVGKLGRTITERVGQLGNSCGVAFRQVKRGVEHLTEAVDETKQDLSRYGGYITQSTWEVDPLIIWGKT